ncbi:MAG: ribonuclease III [Alphaproteobacteria bacterium]|nr:ribonuclease III [Alphaproteobacteria bacterium]
MSKNSDLEATAGYAFKDKHLLDMALTHASVQGKEFDYERLEFLGDRVAGLVIADLLYKTFPEEEEGCLARRHTALVQQNAMVAVAQKLDIARYLHLSNGESLAQGDVKDAILGDAVEALTGAIFLDGGFAAAEKFVETFWAALLHTQTVPPQDAKTALQEWVQARSWPLPVYDVVGKEGPDHAPEFEVEVKAENLGAARAKAGSKRAAEKAAAAELLLRIEDVTAHE